MSTKAGTVHWHQFWLHHLITKNILAGQTLSHIFSIVTNPEHPNASLRKILCRDSCYESVICGNKFEIPKKKKLQIISSFLSAKAVIFI